jgi:oligopeptidase B
MPRRLLAVMFLLMPLFALAQLNADVAAPPVAQRIPQPSTIHGDTRQDDYYWLREKDNPAVRAYLEAENAYTKAVTKPTEGLQEKLYSEMLGRIKQTDSTVPVRNGDWWYYSRTEQGKQYSIQCRKHKTLEAPEEILLDLNVLAKDKEFLSLGAMAVSDNGQLLAYSLDSTGFREYVLHVKDLKSGTVLPDTAEKVTSFVWAADNKTLFFVTEDEAKRSYRLNKHVLGSPSNQAIYQENDELYDLAVGRSLDRKLLFLTSASSRTSEVRYLASDQPAGNWKIILPRSGEHEYYADHRDGQFWLRTNQDAKNFRLVAAPMNDPQPKNWKPLVAERADARLEDVDVFAEHAMLTYQGGSMTELVQLDPQTLATKKLTFTEPMYAVSGGTNPEYATGSFRFHYESMVTPPEVWSLNLKSGERTLLKRAEVNGYDAARYTSERLHATAADGTRIPISLVYRKDARANGPAPLLLYGYGAYGLPLPTDFDSARVSLLDRGMIFAQAHIRGGGDLGEAWHEAGRMMQKRNTFTDFIAAGDYLVAQKYTTPAKLAIQGGSAGGLLIGAVLHLRPDLCKVALLQVPFVDAINTMLDPTLPLTTQEYLEWGDPNEQKAYAYIKSYCPYTNITAKKYPAILVETSLNDSQVMYWEPAKFVAKLRALKTDKNVLLLKVNMAAGHGGASGRYEALRETAFTDAFLLTELGLGYRAF